MSKLKIKRMEKESQLREMMKYTRGGQKVRYWIRMFTQIYMQTFLWMLFICFIIFAAWMFYTAYGPMKLVALNYYAHFLHFIGAGHNKYFTVYGRYADTFINSYGIQEELPIAWHKIWVSAFSGSLFALGSYLFIKKFIVNRWFMKVGDDSDIFLEGTKLVEPKELNKAIERSNAGRSNIKIAGQIWYPRFYERQGTYYQGSNGTGKTQNLMHFLDQIRAKGDIAILYDKECTIKPYYFNPATDKELNPLSVLCENWDIWQECQNPLEIGGLANYLMPKSVQGSDPFWVDAARTIFSAVFNKMKDDPDRSIIKLLSTLLTTSLEDMRHMLKGTESETLVNKDIEKTAISIRAVMATYTKALRFMEGLNKTGKPSFSIKDWVLNNADKSKNKGWLFISSRAKYHSELKPLISAWLGLSLLAIQSLEPNDNRKVWFICDEFASLHRLDGFSSTVNDVRKFGGCTVLCVQSMSQLKFIYGDNEANAILDAMNTSIYHRSPKKAVAEWVANDMGRQWVKQFNESSSYGPEAIRDGSTSSMQRVEKFTVSPTDVTLLEPLECYVSVSGFAEKTKLQVQYVKRKQNVAPLIERKIDYEAIETIGRQANALANDPRRSNDVKKQQMFEKVADLMSVNEDLADEEDTTKLKDAILKEKEAQKQASQTQAAFQADNEAEESTGGTDKSADTETPPVAANDKASEESDSDKVEKDTNTNLNYKNNKDMDL